MKRLEDWPSRLEAYLEAKRDIPFAWGTNDCCSFAAGAIEAMTGESLPTAMRGTEAEARELLQSWGGLITIVTKLFGKPHPINFAHRGDLVLLRNDPDLLGIFTSSGVAAPGELGMLLLPRSAARVCWRVGR